MPQQSLFSSDPKWPEGFRYENNFITLEEEQFLLENIQVTELKPYEYEGFEAKRKVKSYTTESGYPDFLQFLLPRIAEFAGESVDKIEHALITEYSPGTPIGWHADMPPYNKVIGISLASIVPFRFRRKVGNKWERITISAEPRSIYLMSGPSRYEWQHSIPPVENWRYSITFRTIV